MTDYRDPLTDEQAEQMERGLRRLLNTPPKVRGRNPKVDATELKERPTPKGRTRKPKAPS
jgi:hypothetical protein